MLFFSILSLMRAKNTEIFRREEMYFMQQSDIYVIHQFTEFDLVLDNQGRLITRQVVI